MIRFKGEALSPSPRIAVISNDALGNYIAITPLLQMLRAKYSFANLHYYGGVRTQELWSQEPMLDWGYPLFGSSPAESTAAMLAESAGDGYDLVINVEASPWAKAFAAIAAGRSGVVVGPCLGEDGRGDLPFLDDDRGRLWTDPDWTAADLPCRFPFLSTGFIGEIFCRLAYLTGPVPRYQVPSTPVDSVPDVLIATAASLPEKLWPVDRWLKAVQSILAHGRSVGLLGAKPMDQSKYWQGGESEQALVDAGALDLRGKLSLPEVVGALSRAKHVLSLDNGIVHLAAATSTPTVGLFRYGIHRLWAPPVRNVTVLTPGENRPVSAITVEEVEAALEL